MVNFKEQLKDVLRERNITVKQLEDNNILKKNVFYEYKDYMPSLQNAIAIANYLNVSLDYILNKSSINNFKKYDITRLHFYSNLEEMLNVLKISKSKMCADLNISRNNLTKWKNGSCPKLSTLLELSNYLECMIDDLLH